MIYGIPPISDRSPSGSRRLQGGRLQMPIHLAESIGEIGAFTAGRLSFVLINSARLTRIALDEHRHAFVPASAPGSFAWSLLSSGAVIKAADLGCVCSGASRIFVRALRAHAHAAVAFAERLCARRTEGSEIDLEREIAHLTRWVGTQHLLGLDGLPDLADEIGAAFTAYSSSDLAGDLGIPPAGQPAGRSLQHRNAVRRLRRAVESAVSECRASAPAGYGHPLTELSLLSDATDHRRADRALSVDLTNALLLSLETTRATMRTVWTLLAEHPQVRARLQQEIDAVVGGRSPVYHDLRRLPYARRVVCETLRLRPPVAMFSRRLASDVQLGAYHVPAGSIVVFNTRRVHRCAQSFPNPDVFDPDRFSLEAAASQPLHSYMPLGPREGSPAARYVMALTQIILATIAQRLVLAPHRSGLTVSAVRSRAPRQRPDEGHVTKRSRSWETATDKRVARPPVPIEASRHEHVQATDGAFSRPTNLILTLDALRL